MSLQHCTIFPSDPTFSNYIATTVNYTGTGGQLSFNYTVNTTASFFIYWLLLLQPAPIVMIEGEFQPTRIIEVVDRNVTISTSNGEYPTYSFTVPDNISNVEAIQLIYDSLMELTEDQLENIPTFTANNVISDGIIAVRDVFINNLVATLDNATVVVDEMTIATMFLSSIYIGRGDIIRLAHTLTLTSNDSASTVEGQLNLLEGTQSSVNGCNVFRVSGTLGYFTIMNPDPDNSNQLAIQLVITYRVNPL